MSEIRITLKSDLCAASGSSFGNTIDTDVALDSLGIPYIPARRIKGCLRQSAEDLQAMGSPLATQEAVERLFGNADGQAGALTVENALLPETGAIRAAIRKAEQMPALKSVAATARVADLFTYVRGSTAMENGKAKDGTLRFIRVMDRYSPLNPEKETTFVCQVFLSDPKEEELLRQCCQATRHIGSSRNRGLGDVAFEYAAGKEAQKKAEDSSVKPAAGERCRIKYSIALKEPVVVPGVERSIAAVSSRAVIGCLSAEWLRKHGQADKRFARLFLSGEVQWQDLTPVSEGRRSVPAPRFLARLKGSETKLVNLLGPTLLEKNGPVKMKPLDGSYAVQTKEGFDLLTVSVSSMYHHSVEKKDRQGELYVEDSVDSGFVYGGSVSVPGDLAMDVIELLQGADFRFGRSKSAQYGACRLLEAPFCESIREEKLSTRPGETVYAVLQSDLLLCRDGMNTPDHQSVREAIAKATGLLNELPVNESTQTPVPDSCAYQARGGYHTLWQLRKSVQTVVMAGSYYQLKATGEEIPAQIRLGEYPQEGMGLIRLIPQSEMDRLIRISEKAANMHQESEKESGEMLNALAVQAGLEGLRETAEQYARSHPKLRGEVQIGRLRMMLDEATDYADLVSRVDSIRTDSYKAKSTKLLQDLYGATPRKTGTQKDSEAAVPNLAAMLGGREELTGLLKQYPEAEKKVLANWKTVLSRVLSLAYYQEKKEEAK